MNAIRAIYPYRHLGLWVFDDEAVGLVQEPFIAGADTAIDLAVAAKGIENADAGFRLLFSDGEFPGYDFRFDWVREGDGGNGYRSEQLDRLDEGWLCPALLKYFESAPRRIYAKFERKPD
ncbi:MAG: DUF6717 family protein [Planctomycetota bacterium]|jgi:hypothetical protein